MTKLFLFILVVDQLIAVRYVLKRHIWTDKVIWCITSCWIFTILIAVSQQLLITNFSYVCIPILLTYSDPLRLILTWSLLLTTFSFVVIIPIMYILIARHVKASNISVGSKNTLTNQKKIIRNGVVLSSVGICSWLPMFIVTQILYFKPESKCIINYLVDVAIHSSGYAFMFYYCYRLKNSV